MYLYIGKKDIAMRRRTFIQTLPLAAAGSAAALKSNATGQGQNGSGETTELPKFQPAGAEQFIRPDVHAGDRPSGASFATRSPALGLNGAAGTAHPLATQTAIAILKRGGSAVDAAVAANAVLGFVEPVSSGLGGDCFAFVWDPEAGKLLEGFCLGLIQTSKFQLSQPELISLPYLYLISSQVIGIVQDWL